MAAQKIYLMHTAPPYPVNLKKIGFIGLGHMGAPMARNLMKAGYELALYDLNKKAVEEVASDKSATLCTSIGEVGRTSDVVVLSLPRPDTVKKVILAPGGLADVLRPGSVIIDMSTTNPDTARYLSKSLVSRGIRFLDAPVSGGQLGAEAGTLTIMVGGDKESYDTCGPIFDVLGKSVFHMGSSGSGQGTKLVNQILVAIHLAAAAEAIHFGLRSGLDMQEVIKAIQTGVGDSRVFRTVAAKMVSGNYGSGSLSILSKDIELILESATNIDTPVPIMTCIKPLYDRALELVFDSPDISTLIQSYEKMKSSNSTKNYDG